MRHPRVAGQQDAGVGHERGEAQEVGGPRHHRFGPEPRPLGHPPRQRPLGGASRHEHRPAPPALAARDLRPALDGPAPRAPGRAGVD